MGVTFGYYSKIWYDICLVRVSENKGDLQMHFRAAVPSDTNMIA